MKTKKYLTPFYLSLIVGASLQAAVLTSGDANIFWNGVNQSSIDYITSWSTNPNEIVRPQSTADKSSWVIGKFNWTSALTDNQVFGFLSGNKETIIRGVYWGDTTTEFDGDLHLYNAEGNAVFTITDGITLDASSSDGNEVKIRRRQNSGTFAVNVGDINVLKSGNVYLGSMGGGEYLTSLSLNGDVNLTNGSKLNIYTNSFSIAENSIITLDNSTLNFAKGVNEISGATLFNWANVDLSNTSMVIKGTSNVYYGTSFQDQATGQFDMGDINVASADTVANFVIYSTYDGPRKIGKITSSVAGAEGSSLTFKTGNASIVAESVDTSVQNFVIAQKFEVLGNYVDKFTGGKSYLKFTKDTNAEMVINGELQVKSQQFVLGAGSGLNKTVKISAAGLTGDSTSFVCTDFVGGDRNTVSNVVLTLTGSGTYYSYLKMTDMNYGDTGSVGSTGTLSIVKNGTGTQYINGQTWYRGTTTVNSGRLLVKADGEGRLNGSPNWGIGKVILNGGYFGATGKNGDIGMLYAQNIEMAGGFLEFNINDVDCDLISLLDATDVMTAASDDLFRFSFVIDAPVVFGMTYKLIEWDPSITTLPYDVKKFVAEFTGQDGVKADFSYAEDGGLNVVFSAIPEPSEVAVLLGAFALAFAFWRRSRKA